MSTGATGASANANYRVQRELGARANRTFAAIREPHELVVLQRFARIGASAEQPIGASNPAARVRPEAMAMLLRDARCLTKNWHPNVARVRHADLRGTELFIASELIEGATLSDLLAAARAQPAHAGAPARGLPHGVLVRILLDVLSGLTGLAGLRDGMHAPLGAYHGALCPTNIVVGRDGVARLINVFRPRPVRIERKSESLGYAAPETLDVEASQDARVDIYAAGVILWEALAGRRLYDEHDPVRVAERQRSEERPSPRLPEGSPFARLADIAEVALAFDPASRFRAASEMATELRRAAGSRLASGSAVALLVADLAGDRIRARRADFGGAPEAARGRMPPLAGSGARPISLPAHMRKTAPYDVLTPDETVDDESDEDDDFPGPRESSPDLGPPMLPPPPRRLAPSRPPPLPKAARRFVPASTPLPTPSTPPRPSTLRLKGARPPPPPAMSTPPAATSFAPPGVIAFEPSPPPSHLPSQRAQKVLPFALIGLAVLITLIASATCALSVWQIVPSSSSAPPVSGTER